MWYDISTKEGEYRMDREFNPDIEMAKIKEELSELIENTEGKDKEMYQELMEFARFVETQKGEGYE
jgi:NTP pyrophosphatase (non-canonical NTP hydrolase)